MDKRESYGWIHGLGVAYCALVGLWSISAYAADGMAWRIIPCVGAQILAVVFAVVARRAIAGGAPWMGFGLILPVIGCSYIAGLGILHAWERDGGAIELNIYGAWMIAGLEPLLFLAAEHVQEHRRQRAEERAREQRATEQDDMEREREREHRRLIERAESEGKLRHIALGAGAALLAVGTPPNAVPQELNISSPVRSEPVGGTMSRAVPERVRTTPKPRSKREGSGDRERAMELIRAGETSARTINRETGVPVSSAQRMIYQGVPLAEVG